MVCRRDLESHDEYPHGHAVFWLKMVLSNQCGRLAERC